MGLIDYRSIVRPTGATVARPLADVLGMVSDAARAFGARPENEALANDSAFATLAITMANEKIDLKRRSFLCNSIPEGMFFNGFFRIANYDDGLTVDVPTPDTIIVRTVALTCDRFYSAWPQDKSFIFKPRGAANIHASPVLFALWNEAPGHGNPLTHTVCVRGTPMRMGPEREHLFQRLGAGGSSWSAGEIDGQMLVIEREKDSLNLTIDHHLWGRRIKETRQTQSLEVTTVDTETTVAIKFTGTDGGDVHGLKVGDRFGVAGASSAVGGITLSGTYTVAAVVDPHTIQVTAGGAANESATSAITTSRVIFHEDVFSEILVDGGSGPVSISNALTDFDGENWPSPVTEWHSFASVPGTDSFWVGISGGDANASTAWAVRVDNVLSGAQIGAAVEIADGVEPAIWHIDDDGNVYGAVRHQSASQPLKIFYLTSALSVSTHSFGNNNFATKCVMSGSYYGGKLVAHINGTRGKTDSTPAGLVGAYIMIWESLADFVATGYENARAIEIASHNWEADTFAGTDTSAVGVGSMCITEDGVICIVTSSENPGTRVDEDGEPDTYLHLIYGVLEPHAHGPSLGTWSSDTVNQLPPEDRFWRTRGLVTAGGTRTVWNSGEAQMARQLRVSVVKSADGIYDYSFIDHTNTPVTLETDRYRVDVQVDGNNGFARIQNRAMSGFTVLTKNDAGVLTNTQHTFEVTVPKVWCGVY